jgi:hypothetical protein
MIKEINDLIKNVSEDVFKNIIFEELRNRNL